MITLETLQLWLNTPTETEHLEFKEAKSSYDEKSLHRYCAAIANEGGGFLIFGVSDEKPRRVVGSKAFSEPATLNRIKREIVDKLGFRVEVAELATPDGRVLVFKIPTRGQGTPVQLDGAYWMRAGESIKPMTPDLLKRIFDEGKAEWLSQPAKENARPDEVIDLLDTQAYFELLKLPYPTSRDGVLDKLKGEALISKAPEGWAITNLAAILLAKKLDAFSHAIARKSPRVVIYEGMNRTKTREDKPGNRGYAVGFAALVDFVHSAAPKNEVIEQTVREEVKMFPKQALRELIANALVHQDYNATGTSVMIEMFDDRVEISNPGNPPIGVERFIDSSTSRNERLADVMRRLGICEEKGSGVDKVVQAAESYQLPAPDFRASDLRTIAILYAHKEFEDMSKKDRIRACYQHCCLLYVSNDRMSNQSLRDRFGLPESKVATASLIIGATKEAGLIKPDDSETASTRYARYLPNWA